MPINGKPTGMIIGVDLGGTHIRAGIEDQGTITNRRKEKFYTKRPVADTLAQLIQFLRPLMSTKIHGIGIGVPSIVDVEQGIVYNVANIPSWVEVPLREILEDEFKVPVCVNNDVNCFILGEHRFGVARDYKNVVGISSGTGLGCGIIINNRLYHGNNCGAGEIGLLHYKNHNIEYYSSGNLFEACFGVTAEAAHRDALSGDKQATSHWRMFGTHLAETIKSVVLTYDPEAIVLGGSLSNAFRLFSESMHESLGDFPYPRSIQRLKIHQSENQNITLLGAASLCTEREQSPARYF